jgi:NAD(P)-dependent dehydrogenase (short-subunit alcohol dehydrogenase family)
MNMRILITGGAGFLGARLAREILKRGQLNGQTVSELVIAEPLADEALVDALRSLGHQFGVGISTLGIHLSQLDALPSSKEIRAMPADAFEHVHNRLHIQRITIANPRQTIDWPALSALRKKHDSVADMVRWLSECLAKRKPEWVGGVVR